MKIYGKDYEGQSPSWIFPRTTTLSDGDLRSNLNALKKHYEAGGKLYVEITTGARKGTIGELIIPSFELDDVFTPRAKTGMGERRSCKVKTWQLKFDDRKTTVNIGVSRYDYDWKGVLRFGAAATTWVYETKERPKVEPIKLKDHFGVKLEVGQVVLFLHGKANDYENRFGKVKRISDKGTIWIEAFRTREHHKAEELHNGIFARDLFVLDGDLRDKAMKARLSL